MWSHKEFPLIDVGVMTLNRNPEDYFAEVEQIAFSPSHMIPGIEPSPDKMLQVGKLSCCDFDNNTALVLSRSCTWGRGEGKIYSVSGSIPPVAVLGSSSCTDS